MTPTPQISTAVASLSRIIPFHLLPASKALAVAACVLTVGCAYEPVGSSQGSLRAGEQRGAGGPYMADAGTEDVAQDVPEDVAQDVPEDVAYDVPEDVPRDAPGDVPDVSDVVCIGVQDSSEKTKLTSHEASEGAQGEADVEVEFHVPSLADSYASAELTLNSIGAASVFHEVFGNEVPFSFDPNGTIAERFNYNVLRDTAFTNWEIATDGLLVGGQSIQCQTTLDEASRTYLKVCSGALRQAVKSVYIDDEFVTNDLGSSLSPVSASVSAGILAYSVDASIRYDLVGNVLGDPRLRIRGTDFTNSDVTVRAELDVRNVPAGGCRYSLGVYHTERETGDSSTSFMFNIAIR